MTSKIFTIFLILLTLLFFVSHHTQMEDSLAFLPKTQSVPSKIIENEFLVLFENSQQASAETTLSELGFSIEAHLGEWLLIKRKGSLLHLIDPGSDPDKNDQKIIAMLENQPEIFAATKNIFNDSGDGFLCQHKKEKPIDHAQAYKGLHDPLFDRQWYLGEAPGMNVIKAWNITKGNDKTLIAVVDRNFDLTQDDIDPSRCKSRRFYYKNILDYLGTTTPTGAKPTYAHGSQVLAVLAPCTDNETGLSAIDWHAQVFAIDSKHDGSLFARMFGVWWAIGEDPRNKNLESLHSEAHFTKNYHPAKVINASFGFIGNNLLDPPYEPVLDVVGEVNRRGSIIVASAGNEGNLADRRLPGSAGGVITVGGIDRSGKTASFSNFSRDIDVVGPSKDILSVENNEFVLVDGTSFSSPLVAAVVSLMLSVNPRLSWKHVEYILKKTAHPLSCKEYCPDFSMSEAIQKQCLSTCCIDGKNVCGSGLVDAFLAVSEAKKGLPQTVLIDVEDYYIPLSEYEKFTAKVMVKNWGQKHGQVMAKTNDPHLKVQPATFEIEEATKDGAPSYKEVTIYYDKVPTKELAISIVFWSANDNEDLRFDDRIEAIVGVKPDNPRKPKKLKDLGL